MKTIRNVSFKLSQTLWRKSGRKWGKRWWNKLKPSIPKLEVVSPWGRLAPAAGNLSWSQGPNIYFVRGNPNATGKVKDKRGNNNKGPTDKELENIYSFITEKYGLDPLDKLKHKECREIIMNRARSTRCNDYTKYLNILKTKEDELQKLLCSLVVPETSFFRMPGQFRMLQKILPEIIERNKEQKRLRIWSTGCATGEEPYSIAMLLLNEPKLEEWDIEILATDIVDKFLQHARKGEYAPDLRKIDKEFRKVFDDFIIKKGEQYKVKNEVKRIIAFEKHNLMDKSKYSPDIIFCRQVIIYFPEEKQIQTLRRFYESLPRGGYLFLGFSEAIFKLEPRFISRTEENSLFYQKPVGEKGKKK